MDAVLAQLSAHFLRARRIFLHISHKDPRPLEKYHVNPTTLEFLKSHGIGQDADLTQYCPAEIIALHSKQKGHNALRELQRCGLDCLMSSWANWPEEGSDVAGHECGRMAVLLLTLGLDRWGKLRYMTASNLMSCPGFGKTMLGYVREAMSKDGFHLKGEEPSN